MMVSSFLSCITLCVMGSIITALALPPTEAPLIHGHPFVALWNIPSEVCQRLHVPLDTAAFKAVTTPKAVPGQFLTIFYEDRLGLYPKFDNVKHKYVGGGIPQNGNLPEHLAKAQRQIDYYIPKDSTPGLAVIDWESWRPVWDQNWGSKRIYQNLSKAQALEIAPFLSSKSISKLAKSQFERASRSFMEKTISLGTSERPRQRWGFYLYPNCFNYDWDMAVYTGKCSKKTQKQNNEMLWLWEKSTALFPSVYLHLNLKNSPHAALFVRNRVLEALRVAALPKRPYTVPVYVYSMPRYREQSKYFQTQADLVSTVGESAALGASGLVMWGGYKDYTSEDTCQSLSQYLKSTLNPYIANVTAAAMLCSEVLCQGNGRCVRKDFNSAHYLHLNPAHFTLLRADGKYVAVGLPSSADLAAWDENFTCQCYAGWSCSPKLVRPTTIRRILI